MNTSLAHLFSMNLITVHHFQRCEQSPHNRNMHWWWLNLDTWWRPVEEFSLHGIKTAPVYNACTQKGKWCCLTWTCYCGMAIYSMSCFIITPWCIHMLFNQWQHSFQMKGVLPFPKLLWTASYCFSMAEPCAVKSLRLSNWFVCSNLFHAAASIKRKYKDVVPPPPPPPPNPHTHFNVERGYTCFPLPIRSYFAPYLQQYSPDPFHIHTSLSNQMCIKCYPKLNKSGLNAEIPSAA